MKYISQAAVLMALSSLAPGVVFGQIDPSKLTVTNYQLVDEVHVSRTVSQLTYRADLVNTGPATPALSAVVTSVVTSIQIVPGFGTLRFPATTVANPRVTSTNTFMVLVDRTGNTDFSNLRFSFSSVAPVANAGPNQTVAVGSTVTLNGSGSTNPSGIGTLTYSWAFSSLPAGSHAVLTGSTTVNPTFVADVATVASNYVIILTVSNGAGSDTASVTVSTVNTPPVADAGLDQTVLVGAVVHLNGSKSSDKDGDPLTYRWSFVSRPAGSAAALNNTTLVNPTFTVDRAGTYTVQLIVNDGKVDSQAALVKITTQNTPPVADAGLPQTVAVGAVVQLNGSQSSDVDGDPLTYRWSLTTKPTGSAAALNNTTLVNPTFTVDKAGTYVAQLIVNDGKVDSSNIATVTISTSNTPPMANAGLPQTVNVGALVQLNGSQSSDVDGDPLTYRWSLTTRPANSTATLSNTTIVNPTFTVDIAGTYVAQLIVNDGKVDSAPATVTISASTQTQPPTANAGPNQALVHGAVVTLNGSGTDPQGLPLTFLWTLTTKPAGSNAALSNATAPNPTFIADLVGTYVAQLIVNNGVLSSNPSTVMISAGNTMPVANAGPDQNVATRITVTLNGSASSDADHDPLTYSWAFQSRPSGSTAVLLNPTTISPTFLADIDGPYVVQLIVNDGFISSNPDTVMINAGTNPISLAPNPLNLLLNAPGVLTVSIIMAPAAGSGGQVINLSVFDPSVVTAPASVTIPEGATSTTATITPLKLGGTQILASATTGGLSPGSVVVNVGQPSITLSLSSTSVGISATITGTVTLSAPAPTNGITVTLTAGGTGGLTLPAIINIAAGSQTATFPVIGAAPAGPATITASSPGYVSGSMNLTVVTLGQITLQSGVAVAPGQTAALGVSLVTGAPVGGVTINLVSSDPTRVTVTPSVFIAAGATTPATPAQVTGVNLGSATITASAPGFTGDAQTVQVAANFTFAPPTLTIGVGSTTNLTLTVTGAAPVGGITVTLNSDNPAIASVPGSVTIPQNQSSVTVPVQAVAAGVAKITASSSGIASGSATITVVPGLAISTTTLPPGTVGIPYNFTVTATGGTAPITFTATGLPGGLSISAGGQITGTPTTAGPNPSVVVTATDSSSPTKLTATATLSITINPPLVITTTSLPNGIVGVPYNATVTASGGTPPYTFTATGLPTGLSIASTGQISGTPTTVGSSTATITVTDSTIPTHATATATLSITIGPRLTITTTSLPNGVVGSPYTATVAATGGTPSYTFSATGLPAGLSISASGQIAGTPTTAQPNPAVVITVTDSTNPVQTATATLSITIGTQLAITGAPLPNGIVGEPYSASVAGSAAGGTPPYTFTATGLPAGLSISAAGQITGTPTGAGTSTVVVTVTDSADPKGTAPGNFPIGIIPGPSITTTSLPPGEVGKPYSATVNATGGTPPYTFTATGLPGGLSISADGQITGAPAGPGSFTPAITVTDSSTPVHLSAPKSFPLPVVAGGPPITALSNVTVGKNLQAPITFVLSAASPNILNVMVTSDNPNVLLIDARTPGALGCTVQNGVCTGQVIVSLPAGVGAFTVIAQALADSGTAHVTASATGYSSGQALVTLAPSAFVLSGPNGVGASFVSNQGVKTPLSVIAEQLDSSGLPAQIQQVRAFFVVDATGKPVLDADGNPMPAPPLAVTLSSSNPSAGTVPPQVSFSGGTDTVSTQFSANGIVATTVLTANEPAGFATPSNNANTLVVTVQATSISPANVTVGQGLETDANFTLQGAPTNSQPFLVTSKDPTKLLFSLDTTSVGSPSITITVPAGFSNSPDFFVYGLGSSGTVGYTVCQQVDVNTPQCATGGAFGSGDGTVTLAPSGFVIQSPFGIGANFNTTSASGNSNIGVISSLLDSSGNFVLSQAVAGGTSVNVNVTSSNTAVGTITTSPVTIAGGNNIATTQFHPVANGSTVITAVTPGGFTNAPQRAVTATVESPRIVIGGGFTIGNSLEQQDTIILSAPAPTNLVVTLTVTAGSLLLSSSATAAGLAQISVTIPAGQSLGTYFLQGLSSSGVVSVRATANGYIQGTGTSNLSPSGVVIGGPAGPGFTDTISKAAGNAPVTINTVVLDPNTNGVIQNQPLAGGMSASVPVSNSNSAAGTFPATVTVNGGSDTAVANFVPGTVGQSTVLSVSQPTGFTTPITAPDQTKLTIQVSP